MSASNWAIRPAREADLDAILAIERAHPELPHWEPGRYAEELRRPGTRLLAAEQGGELAGYALLWLVAGEAQLHAIAAHPARLRAGAGRALLAACADEARRAGCAVLTLEVSERNAAARELYARAGFRVVGRRPKYYNGSADALLMDLLLP